MKKIIAANWKLHKNPKETKAFFTDFLSKVPVAVTREVVFFPPATSLEKTSEVLKSSPVKWGSQNCCWEVKGAFTGETSAEVVRDLGGEYILLGHSERRTLFHETDEMIGNKLKIVQELDLTPMLCIGETLLERESNKTLTVLRLQLKKGLEKANLLRPLVIAYEPVWAIGTGKVATLEQIKDAHFAIFQVLVELGFPGRTPILYGGSVKPENAKEISMVEHVSGFLVGGASLEVPTFLKICNI